MGAPEDLDAFKSNSEFYAAAASWASDWTLKVPPSYPFWILDVTVYRSRAKARSQSRKEPT